MTQLVPDGQLSFEGGQDSSLPPSRLAQNKYERGINVTAANGVIRPRYGIERKKLSFPRAGYAYRFNRSADFENTFNVGKFQAAAPYRIGNRFYAVVVISGVIFLVNLDSYEVTVLTIDRSTQLNETSDRINWSDAGRFLVLYDFPSRPIIIEGQTARRSDPDLYELPAANLGVYNQSRLFFSNYGNEFTAGDPVGNVAALNAPITVEEIVTPTDFYGDIYQINSRYDAPITAMATLQNTDSSTGVGQLLVASADQMFAYNTIDGRDTWTQGKFGKSISDHVGVAGARSLINVGADLFFISSDGQLRSITTTQTEQTKWAQVPMDLEVSNWKAFISPDLIKYSVLCYFRNKLFMSARPYRIKAQRLDGRPILDVAHSGILVFSTDNISRLGSDSAPAWDGLWIGCRPLEMFTTNKRMFVVSKDYYSRNTLYEMDPDLSYDRTENGQRRQIKGTVYTREHFFEDMFALKKPKNIEVGISDIKGMFEVGIDYKPSHSANFLYLSNFKHFVPVEYKNIASPDIRQRKAMSFRELKFGFPDSTEGHPVTDDLYDRVKRVQLKITLKGDSWQLNEYRLTANVMTESSTEFLPNNLPEKAEYEEEYSDWTYEEFGL